MKILGKKQTISCTWIRPCLKANRGLKTDCKAAINSVVPLTYSILCSCSIFCISLQLETGEKTCHRTKRTREHTALWPQWIWVKNCQSCPFFPSLFYIERRPNDIPASTNAHRQASRQPVSIPIWNSHRMPHPRHHGDGLAEGTGIVPNSHTFSWYVTLSRCHWLTGAGPCCQFSNTTVLQDQGMSVTLSKLMHVPAASSASNAVRKPAICLLNSK